MLQEEIEDAIEDNKPFEFEWFLIITKVYKGVESMADKELEEEQQIGKRKKTKLVYIIFRFMKDFNIY
ncbi:23122_t:CDS:2 [Entrophospora sp. SA101]|nr:9579_t:CDS:2 [Entrophospora sp. SA101]CAJ0628380.1 2743_t:CDS:2 [Entrophospora sp. SA101]CAJ0747965.1 13594_t:CDS:2 [Entrophospora sp. SA101]CAJ0752675.1 23122_t:CDS:2 [Entrophospora sp. SA101]CAJ0913834.1 20500_t:CDS:2 [Entrophospora sp. SA101]